MRKKQYKVLQNLFVIMVVIGHSISPSILLAQDMPNREELTSSIQQNATTQTSQINSPPSSPQETTVTNTGDNTNTSSDSSSSTSTDVNNQNNAQISQQVNAQANTGDNEASRNISIGGNAGMIETGDASVNTQAVVSANSNTTGITGSGPGATGSTTGVANTGNGVTTSVSNNTATSTLVNNGNATTITQGVNANANTGGNKADRNISMGGQSGVIKTGNASTNTGMLVTANGSVTLIGGTGNGNGPGSGASIVLANTGDRTRIDTNKNSTSFMVITNENRAAISQMCGTPIPQSQLLVDASSCTANTGNNVANRNIGRGGDAGVVLTGDATVNVLLAASVNGNSTGIAGAGGGSTPLYLQVANTGDDSAFNANSNNSSLTSVQNNNNAFLSQQVNAKANTGSNQANRNISLGGNAGVIKTGNASVNTVLLAQVNDNNTQLIGTGGSGAPSGTLNVVNTGDDVQVSQNSSSSNSTNVTNNNFLNLLQSVVSFATTGLNEVSRNIGEVAGFIVTGDARVDESLGAQANSNTTVISSSSSSVSPIDPNQPTPTPITSQGGSSSSSSSSNSNTNSNTSTQSNTNGTTITSNSNTSSSGTTQGATSILAGNNVSDKPKGMVLGATSLPATGPGSSLLVMIILLMLLASGLYVQKFDVSEV